MEKGDFLFSHVQTLNEKGILMDVYHPHSHIAPNLYDFLPFVEHEEDVFSKYVMLSSVILDPIDFQCTCFSKYLLLCSAKEKRSYKCGTA